MFKKAVASVVIVMVALTSPMGVAYASPESTAATEATEAAEGLGLGLLKLGLAKHVAKKLLLLKAAKYGIAGGYGGIGIHGNAAGQIGGGININGAGTAGGYLRGGGAVSGGVGAGVNGAGGY